MIAKWRTLLAVLVAGGALGGATLADENMAGSANYERPSSHEAVRFLVQASYGPTRASVIDVRRRGYGGWIEQQFETKGLSAVGRFLSHEQAGGKMMTPAFNSFFWERALFGEDQLRWRMTYALSQIVVVSEEGLEGDRSTLPGYIDILQKQAFGNYCDLIREVTFSPAMGVYLTYLKNEKANEKTGFEPDENYAREVMQLFTIGLEELNPDGTGTGRPTYGPEDVSGLAAVFTGLAPAGTDFKRGKISGANRYLPLEGHRDYHEGGRKVFLGTEVNSGAYAEKSIAQALDHLLAHPNVAPFISKQLIQRFVTSNPKPEYVERVANAFNRGLYRMPSGNIVGEGRRCDLKATIAAILLDEEARSQSAAADPTFGKLREPILRSAHILRVTGEPGRVSRSGLVPEFKVVRADTASNPQTPFHAPSVFNFYRPGYVPAGTQIAEQGLVAPEFQIATAQRALAYISWVESVLAGRWSDDIYQVNLDPLLRLAEDPARFVQYLDDVLLYGTLLDADRRRIEDALDEVRIDAKKKENGLKNRVKLGFAMATTLPEYQVQR
jgi:uncharacterized protein (DUF1800 family)